VQRIISTSFLHSLYGPRHPINPSFFYSSPSFPARENSWPTLLPFSFSPLCSAQHQKGCRPRSVPPIQFTWLPMYLFFLPIPFPVGPKFSFPPLPLSCCQEVIDARRVFVRNLFTLKIFSSSFLFFFSSFPPSVLGEFA